MRWGVIATGGIAAKFVTDLSLLDDERVVAVGSRSTSGAQRFGSTFDIPSRHGSYADLVADPEVEAVYVATPHPGHYAAARLAIDAGKHVLVEKPFTINAIQAQDLVDRARVEGVALMEAMWTRFLPHMVAVRELLAAGALGDIRLVTAEHGQCFDYDAAHRIFAPELGGGALLDLGVYPVSFASMVLGPPTHVSAVAGRAPSGVDAQTSAVLSDGVGRHAVITTTSGAATANRGAISGSSARIEIDPVWYRPVGFTMTARSGEAQRYEFPHEGNGLRHQAAEFARCVAAGMHESMIMPLAETVTIMATMDEIRRQIGLRYDADDDPLRRDS